MKLATFWHDENADINSMDAAHVRTCWRGDLCANRFNFLYFSLSFTGAVHEGAYVSHDVLSHILLVSIFNS